MILRCEELSLRVVIEAIYFVGVRIIETTGVNPKIKLYGVGEWELVSQGRMIVGYKKNDPDFGTVKKTGGDKAKNLQHTHDLSEHTHELPTLSHTGAAVASGVSGVTTENESAHTHTQGNTGLAVTEMSVGASSGAMPDTGHTHTNPATESGSAHNHAVIEPNDGAGHDHGFTEPANHTGSVGIPDPDVTGSALLEPQDVLNPYEVVYIWERVA